MAKLDCAFMSPANYVIVGNGVAGTTAADTLRKGDAVIASWNTTGTPSDEIATVDLIDQDTDDAIRSFLAMARDGNGEPVWGTQFEWTVQGRPIETTGDVYRYTYDPDVDVELEALFGEESATATLHGTGGPTDSTALGCSVPLPFPGAAAIGLALLTLRRRRT